MKKTEFDQILFEHNYALEEMRRYGDEMMEALAMHEKDGARETDSIFMGKAKRAMVAYENWRKSSKLTQQAIDSYYANGFQVIK